MGILDSISDAAGSVKDRVSSGVKDASKAVERIRHSVEEAPAKLARGAAQALKGVDQIKKTVERKADDVVRAGVDHARTGIATLRRGAKDIKGAASTAASWTWKHKGEIGFWVGTTAPLLATPVSGGASGALAGGLMAARAASLGVKVAQMGRAGVGAVKLAKAAGTAVQGARGAMGATRAGGLFAKAGETIHTGRVALGGTKAGQVMMKAQKPVTAAGTVLAGAHFGETSVKYARGDASKKDLALASLWFAPAGFGAVRGVAARRAAGANEKAAEVVAGRLDDVAAQAATATDDAAHVARVAPAVNAPQTAGAAAATRDRAARTADKAADLRHKVAITAHAGKADDAISASTLADELEDVALRAGAAKRGAEDAVDLAPTTLTSSAHAARERLVAAERTALQARRSISSLATKQRHADKLADGAGRVEDAIGTTGLHAFNVNNGLKAWHEQSGKGYSLTDGSLARGLATWLFSRNARIHAVAPSTAPAPAPTR